MAPERIGYQTERDVLVNQTADGVDLNEIWGEVQDLLKMWHGNRTTVASLLSYPTTVPADPVPQTLNADSFEVATEFGVPRAVEVPAEYLKIGFTFADYDKAMRFTWKFLRDATAGQVRHSIARIFKADNRSTNGLVLNRLFSPVEDNNEWQHRVLGLWNGTLGLVPPSYMGNTFDTSTTHYFASQAAVIDSGDVEE